MVHPHFPSPEIDTEYDRAKGPPYNGSRSHLAPGSLKALCFQTYEDKLQQGDARGAREVRRGTSSIYFRLQSYWSPMKELNTNFLLLRLFGHPWDTILAETITK